MGYRIKAQEQSFFEVTLAGRKAPKRVPLMSSLPVKWVRRANKIRRETSSLDEGEAGTLWFDFACDLFADYLGQETVDNMTAQQVNDLFEAWSAENEDQDGANPGE